MRNFFFTLVFAVLLSGAFQELDKEYKELLEKEIKEAMEKLKFKNQELITKGEFIKLFKYLFTKNQDQEGVKSSAIEDQFYFDVIRKVASDVPEKIKFEDIAIYLDPHKTEKIVNEMLGQIDLGNIMSQMAQEKKEQKNQREQKEEL